MCRRKLEDLNLLDDFLFGAMVEYPEIGETFLQEILGTIFGRKFGKLTLVPQKVYYGSNTDKRGTRLDVYVEEKLPDEAEIAYDVEPEQKNSLAEKISLPKRVRFYHAKIDAKSLKAGEKTYDLKRVVVIMIMPFDPFGYDQMIYTVRNKCEEEPDMEYDDGAMTLFLYTKGSKGKASEELRQLLAYMEQSTKENAINDQLRNLHQMVEKVKQDEEVSLAYMKVAEREEMLIEEGIQRGKELGRKLGIQQERENTLQERENTLRERERAEAAEKELERLKRELEKLKSGMQ